MIIVYPLGNSDMVFDEAPLLKAFGDKDNIRSGTEKIIKEINSSGFELRTFPAKLQSSRVYGIIYPKNGKEKHTLKFPLLSALFEYIDEEYRKRPKDVRYYFLYTNQTGDKNGQDTIHIYEIIEKFLKEGLQIKDVRGKSIEVNPTKLSLLKGVAKSLRTDLEEMVKTSSGNEEIIIAIGPGTPQMNIALLLYLFDVENVHFAYIPRGDRPYNLQFAREIHSSQTKRAVLQLVEHFDYRSALLLYKDLPDEEKREINLLRALSLRVDFNFNEAYEALRKYLDKFEHKPSELKDFELELKRLANLDKKALLQELYYEFALRIEMEHYLEAVAMLFRIEEELLKMLVEKVLNVTIEGEKTPNGDLSFGWFWKRLSDENKDLVEELNKEKVRTSGTPNRITYQKILNYLYNEYKSLSEDKRKEKEKLGVKNITELEKALKENISKVEKVLEFYEYIEKEKRTGAKYSLVELRNKTPFAHGFEGVSEKKVKETAIPVDELLGKVKETFKALDVDVIPPNDLAFPFRKVNGYLEKKLKE